MTINDIESNLDELISKHEDRIRFCEIMYQDSQEKEYQWLNVKRIWQNKLSILKEMRELASEYREQWYP